MNRKNMSERDLCIFERIERDFENVGQHAILSQADQFVYALNIPLYSDDENDEDHDITATLLMRYLPNFNTWVVHDHTTHTDLPMHCLQAVFVNHYLTDTKDEAQENEWTIKMMFFLGPPLPTSGRAKVKVKSVEFDISPDRRRITTSNIPNAWWIDTHNIPSYYDDLGVQPAITHF